MCAFSWIEKLEIKSEIRFENRIKNKKRKQKIEKKGKKDKNPPGPNPRLRLTDRAINHATTPPAQDTVSGPFRVPSSRPRRAAP